MQTKTDRIFYWNGIFDPNGLTVEYEALIQKLVNGDYLGLNLEKLNGHNVYSVRINDCDRLLFTTICVNSIPYLMVLDIVLNHDYAKSRFLKPGVLKNYLELNGQMLTEQLTAEQFQAHQVTTPFLSNPEKTPSTIQYARIDYYNQQFIELNDTQLCAATKTSLPLVISGVPGSGKSCIALLILAQYIESHPEPEGPILYCCQSEALAAHMQQTWNALPIAQCGHTVLFKSYEQLIKDSLLPETRCFVDKDECIEWLKEYIKDLRPIDKVHNKEHFSPDCEAVYQEFRIISGCLETYQEPGKKKFLFHEPEEKQWIKTAYEKYQKHLNDKKAIHAPFYPLDTKNKCKLIVADEAQDFSHLQLKLLAELADNKQICYCEDDKQSLSDNKSKLPFIEGLMHEWLGKKQNHIVLDRSYRFPAHIAAMANAVSALKSAVTGNGQSEIISTNTHSKQGCAKWFNAFNKTELAKLKKEAQSPDFAIITLREHKEEAKKIFNTDLVFTAEEIKGLEYKKIMAYRLLDNPLFEEANKAIAGKNLEISKKTQNRAKAAQGNEQLGTVFNNLYTAFTRPTETLYIYQPYCHKRQHLLKHLKDAIPKEDNEPSPIQAISTAENETQWFNHVKQLLEQGHEDKAESIYLNTLGKNKEEFEKIKLLFSTKKVENTIPVLEPLEKEPVKEVKTKNSPQTPVKQITPTTVKTTKKAKKKQQQALKQTVNSTAKAVNINMELLNYRDKLTAINTNMESYLAESTIQKLLQCKDKLTKDSLSAFFKNKNAVTYLFDTPCKDGDNLFSILLKPPYQKVFLAYMQTHENQLFFTKHMTGERLCKINPATTMSPLYLLSASIEGINVIKTWFKINKNLIPMISIEALCTPRPSTAGHSANTSTFYFLSQTEAGIEILTTLFKKNTSLTQALQSEALCLPLTSQSENFANQSPLYCLVQSSEGVALLKSLIARNETLALNIQGKDLCRALSMHAGEEANASSLLYLTQSEEHIELLETLLTKNPNLAASITVEALCLALTSKAGENANTSPLFFLAQSEKGCEILKILFERNSNLVKSMGVKAFCLPLTSKAGTQANLTPFYYFSLQSRAELLELLFLENPNLASNITTQMLCLTNSLGISPLFTLSTHPEGINILNTLLLNNDAKLAKTIPAEALCQALTPKAGIYANLSPLFLLSLPESIKPLQTMLKHNPNLAKTITAEALCRTAEKDNIPTSPLFVLLRSSQGIEILTLLIKNNPALAAIILKDKALSRSPSKHYQVLSKQLTETYLDDFREKLVLMTCNNPNAFFQTLAGDDKQTYYTVSPHK